MAAARVPAIHAIFGEDTARARRNGPETSFEAADSNRVATSIAAVFDTLTEYGPHTDERLVARMHDLGHPFTPQRIRTARAALVKDGTVYASSRDGRTVTGRRARVWALTVPPATFTPELFGDDEALR